MCRGHPRRYCRADSCACHLVQADGWNVTQVAQVWDAWHVHSIKSQAAVVCNHLRQDVEDRLQREEGEKNSSAGTSHSNKAKYREDDPLTLGTVLS